MQRGKKRACEAPLRPVWALRTADIGPIGAEGHEGLVWCREEGG
jgi:hypothetical protein